MVGLHRRGPASRKTGGSELARDPGPRERFSTWSSPPRRCKTETERWVPSPPPSPHFMHSNGTQAEPEAATKNALIDFLSQCAGEYPGHPQALAELSAREERDSFSPRILGARSESSSVCPRSFGNGKGPIVLARTCDAGLKSRARRLRLVRHSYKPLLFTRTSAVSAMENPQHSNNGVST